MHLKPLTLPCSLLVKSDTHWYKIPPTLDKKGRRLIHCHTCKNNWRAALGNILGAKTGCPTCAAAKIDNVWDAHYKEVVSTLRNKEKLNRQQKQWIWRNKDLFVKGKLK